MRNPNGYGSVVKLSGNRRNPFAARKTIGWNDKGHPIYKSIGYYPTREEGMIALAEYNKNPYDLDIVNMTLEEVFEMWEEKKKPKLGKSLQTALNSSYKHCSKYYKMKYKDIRSFHMQDIIDNCGLSYSSQGHIKSLFNHLDRIALEHDIITKSYSSLVEIDSKPESKKIPFTDEQVDMIWDIKDDYGVDTVLIYLYTGFRLNELLEMKTEDVDLEKGIFTGGSKSEAGKNRIIPIHSRIYPMVEKRVNYGFEYFLTIEGKKISRWRYYPNMWDPTMEKLGIEDMTVHNCRHTFRSRLDSAGANKVAIDLMLGHKSKDVGERVYTHKTIEELKEAIELID